MPDLWDNSIWFAPGEQAYWDGQSILTGADVQAAPADDQVQASVVQLIWDRTLPATLTDDVALFSLAFVLDTLSAGTSIISSGNKATIEGLLDTMITDWKAQISSHWTLREYRWHDYTSSWTRPGPATRVTAKGTACTGSATTTLPDQVASSITFKTSSRRHWGRIYAPPLVSTAYGSTGRLSSAQVDGRLAAMRTMLNAAMAAGIPPVVRSTSHRAVMSIMELQMDDTPDVIRSRRAKRPSYRKVYTS